MPQYAVPAFGTSRERLQQHCGESHQPTKQQQKVHTKRHQQFLLTVKIVGVTKAQQTRQNLLGWNPIIISISSQNLCNPVS